MNLIALWPTQFRHCCENPKGLVAVQATKFHSPVRPQATRPPAPPRWDLGSFPSSHGHLGSPRSVSCAQLCAARAASGSPSPGRCKYLFLPWGPRRGHLPAFLPPSLPAGPFPGWRTATRAAAAGSEALVDAVPPRASPPSAGRPRSSRLRGAPSAPAQCPRRGAGLRFLSAAAAVAAATVSFRRGEARNGPVGSPPPFPRPEPPPPGSPGFSPCGVSLPPRRRFLGPRPGGSHCPRGGGSGSRPRLVAPGSVSAVPERRCRRHRRSPPLPLPSGRAGSSCDALGLHLIAQRGPRPGIAQVPVLAR